MRRRVAAVFGVVLAAFVALDAFVVVALWPQIQASEALSTRYAANSRLISRMSGALRALRSEATQHHVRSRTPAAGDTGTADELTRAREEFAAAVREYERVPMQPLEQQEWARLTRDVYPALVATVDEMVAPAPPGAAVDQALLTRLGRDSVQVGNILERLARLNAEGLERAATDIHSAVVLLILIAIGIGLVAIVTMILLVRWALAVLAEFERSTAERLAELDEFAGRVAHDLRNPLQAIGISLSLLQRRASDERSLSTIGRAEDGVRRMSAFIQELLEFARSGARPEPGASSSVADAFAAIEQDLAGSARSADVELVVSAPAVPRVAMSPGALRAVVANLADNAVKHMGPPDGRQRRVELLATDHDREVLIQVRDTGPGIAREDLRRLFEPFFRATSRSGGFGIGLKTVKRLVDTHGGRLDVESEEGRGTTFFVTLPATRSVDTSDTQADRTDSPARGSSRAVHGEAFSAPPGRR